MPTAYSGNSSSQLLFQEQVYQLMEQGIPFICSSAHLRAQVENPETFMEYLDPVTKKMRWHGQPNPQQEGFPPRWYCLPSDALSSGSNTP